MRYFKAITHLVLPSALQSGPGGTHVRLAPGDVVGCADKACAEQSRFVNGRIRANDLAESTEAEFLAYEKAQAEIAEKERAALAEKEKAAETAQAVDVKPSEPAAKPAKGK